MFTFEEYYYYRVIVYNTTNINSQKRSPSTNESYPYSSFIIHHYEIGVQESTLSIPTKLRHETRRDASNSSSKSQLQHKKNGLRCHKPCPAQMIT